VKQIGTAMAMYLGDNDDTYPQSYYYKNDQNSSGGYVHWTGTILPYVKNLNIFISPGDKIGGFAPTNYSLASKNKGWGWPSGQTPQYDADIDVQAPRLSYIGNSLLMPRKRKSADPMGVTTATAIEEVGQIILFGAMTEYAACINGSSVASGQAYKTHRPANAILLEDNGAPFHGEAVDQVGRPYYWAISYQRAMADIESCKSGTPATGLDDARIVDAKACQLETWVKKNPDRTEAWALPACNFTGNLELTLGGAITREAGRTQTTDVVMQGKTLFKTMEPNGWGIGLAAGTARHSLADTRDWYAYVPTSFSFRDDAVVVLTNIGWLREGEARRDRLTWGLGTEIRLVEGTWRIAETFGYN